MKAIIPATPGQRAIVGYLDAPNWFFEEIDIVAWVVSEVRKYSWEALPIVAGTAGTLRNVVIGHLRPDGQVDVPLFRAVFPSVEAFKADCYHIIRDEDLRSHRAKDRV